ncbi:MAG TPA: ribonucleoside triphosphate reductase, partial [Ruminococcus sp.]|nr:ribonucleoside triphosphate reductase [Ruminococcus sp.]
YQEQYGDLYNLEATPAESTTYRLAKHDVARYPDIITAAQPGQTPYYTNSSHLPVGYTEDIFSALDIQDDLQTRYTSGTVFHAFLGEKLPDWKSAANLVRKIAENYKLPYYTMSPTYSVCKNHGYLVGEQYVCPECGCETEVYSRITGYYRPVKNFNDGKAQEFKDRKEYVIERSIMQRKSVVNLSETTEPEAPAEDQVLLFATRTCPNCKMAERFLNQAGIAYQKVIADEEPELVQKYDIHQAPTLIVPNGSSSEKIVNVSNIRRFTEQAALQMQHAAAAANA